MPHGDGEAGAAPRARLSPRILGGLALLVALTIGLRAWGIGWMLPHLPEQDDFVATHLDLERTGEQFADRRLSFSQYPLLLKHGAGLLPDPERDPAELARMDLKQHLANASRDWISVRAIVGALSLVGVLATFAIARRFLSPGWALFAAAFLPASLLLANFGQQGRPHGALAGLVPLAVLAALRLRERPDATNHLLAAGAVGLAAGCLHTAWLTVLPLLAAYALSRGPARPWLDARALLGLGVLALAVPLFYHLILATPLSREQIAAIAPGQTPTDLAWLVRELVDNLDPVGARRVARILSSWEPALGVGLVLAAFLALGRLGRSDGRPRERERRADLSVVLAFVVPYLCLLAMFAKSNERYVIPLLPFAAVATAWGLAQLAERAGRARPLALAGAALLLCASSAAGLKLVWLRGQPDTLSEAATFLAQRVPPDGAGQIYMTPPLELPLARTARTLETDPARQPHLHGMWTRYLADLPADARLAPRFDIEWLDQRAGIGDLGRDPELFAFVDFYGPGWFVLEPERARKHPWAERVRGRIAELGTLAARISPDGDPQAHDSGWTGQDRAYAYGGDWPNNTWRVLGLRAIGPLLEIHRISPQ
jgi:hypothetical protein